MQRAIWWAALCAFGLVCLGVWAFLANWDRAVTIARAQDRVDATAQLFEQHAARAMESADRVVQELVSTARLGPVDDGEVNSVLAEKAKQLVTGSPVASAWVLDRNGISVAESWGHPPRSKGTFTDRAYFQAHLKGNRGLVFGPVQIGARSGQPRFTLSRAIVGADGQFDGVAVTGIYSAYFAEIYSQAALGDKAVLRLMTNDGDPLAEWPLGQLGPDPSAEPRLLARRNLSGYPAVIEVAQPLSAALGEWRQRTTASAFIALGMFAAFSSLTALGIRTAAKEASTRAALRDANENLEARVEERTAALAESQAQMTAILEHLPIGVGVVDGDGRFLTANPGIRRYVRTHIPSRDGNVDQRWKGWNPDGQRIDPADFPGARALRGEAVLEGPDFLFCPEDGPEIWVRILAVPMRDASGAPSRVVLVIQDIDQLKRAQADLAARHDELQALYDTAPVGMGMLDRDLRFVRVNRRLAAFNGLPADAHVGRRLRDVVPDLAEEGEALIRTVIDQQRAIIGHEIAGVTQAQPGVRRSWNLSLNPIVGDRGDVRGINLVVEETTEAKRIAEALAQSEAQLRLSTEGAGVGIWELDFATGRGHWSALATLLLGVDRSVFTPDDWLEAVHPDDRTMVEEAWSAAVSGGGPFDMRYRAANPGVREVRWLHSRGRVEFDAGGRAVHAAGVVFDVTEQARAEADRAAGENRLRLVADAVPALVSFVGPDERYRFVNRSYEAWFGFERADVEGRPMWEVLGEEAYLALRPHVAAVLAGERVRFETMASYRTGGARFIEAEYIPNRLPGGKLDGFFVFVTDVTRRRADEAALRESEQRLQLALAAGQLGDWTWDANTDALSLSGRASEIFGVAAGGPLTWSELSRLLHEDDARLATRAMDKAIASRTDYSIEYRVNRPDGRQTWVAAQGRPTYRADGSPLGMAGIVRDVTDRHQADEHSRMLINELNHRVKNTLATVQSIAAQSLKNSGTAAEARQAIESRLIALSRSHDLLTHQSWEGASLRDVAVQALEPFAGSDGGRLAIEGRDVWLRPNLSLAFGMAFHELATNAAKYGALSVPQGRLALTWWIDTEREGDRLRVRWEERGGPRVAAPARKGFGTRLIERGLAFELGGTVRLDFAPGGVVCEIDTPSPRARAESQAYG